MDSLTSSFDAAAKSSGLSGLLSSLNSMLNDAAADPAVFAHFMQQNQTISPPVPAGQSDQPDSQSSVQSGSQPVVQTQNTVSQTNGQTPVASGKTLTLLKKAVSLLHRVLEQINRRDKGKNSASSNQSVGTSTQTNSSTQNTPMIGNAPSAQDSTVDASPDSNDDSSDAGAIASGPQTLMQLLSELVSLMQTIEKKLVATQDGTQTAATDPSSPASQTDPANGSNDTNSLLETLAQLNAAITAPANSADNTVPSTDVSSGNSFNLPAPSNDTGSAADPLTQLLSLIQSIEQKLTFASSGAQGLATTDVSASADSSSSAPGVNFSEIAKDLDKLMIALRNDAANGNAGGNDIADMGGNSSTAASGLLPSSTESSKPQDPTASDKTASSPLDNFLQLFANQTNSNTSTINPNSWISPVTAGPAGDADGKNGDVFDGNDNGSMSGDANNSSAMMDTTASSSLPNGVAAANPYSFASQLSDMRAVSGGTTGLPSVIDQVLLQLNRGVKGGNDQMTIQLQPADLGKINVQLNISSEGKVQGTVVADNPNTLSLLLKDVRSLERALQEAGLRADPGSLQFSLGGQSGNSGNTSGQTAGNFASGNSSGTGTFIGAPDTTLDVTPDAGETWYLTPDRVNFKV